jgi:PTS system nitrogen regulatory IIA component
MVIDVKKAAFMLGTSEEMLLRWVRQGAIPVVESASGPAFHEKALRDWAVKRHMPIRQDEAPEKSAAEPTSSLVSAVMEGGVHFHVPGSSVSEVLSAAVNRIETPLPIDKTDLLQRLLAREASASTGIGGGIAIPHPGRPIAGILESGAVSVCFLENPVDFSAADQKPVFVLALLLSPSSKRHLELLSKIALCFGNKKVSEMLKTCNDKDSLIDALNTAENETASVAS